MKEELLLCSLCGGKVSSRASVCPHCGSPSFRPEEYLRRVQAEKAREEAARIAEEQRKKADYLRRYEVAEGPEIRVLALGLPAWSPWQKQVKFDGKPWRRKGLSDEHIVIVSDETVPTHVRLKPGHHLVTYENFMYGFSGRVDPKYTATKSFVITAASHTIKLCFRKSLFRETLTSTHPNILSHVIVE